MIVLLLKSSVLGNIRCPYFVGILWTLMTFRAIIYYILLYQFRLFGNSIVLVVQYPIFLLLYDPTK